MKNSFKKLIGCFLAVSLTCMVGLTACSDEKPNTPDSGINNGQPDNGKPEDTVLTKNTDGAVTIKNQIHTEYSDYINYRNPTLHVYNKLEAGEKINIVYFGGSVTNGTGASEAESTSWRGKIGLWFEENYPDQINNINCACGGTGSNLGALRTQRDILTKEPDLLFIEYSINDKYYKSTYEESALQFETIVRQVREAYPNCDIVTVLVSDGDVAREAQKGNLHEQAQAHEDISEEYNISSIHVGRALATHLSPDWVDVNSSMDEGNWFYYMLDHNDKVHPNDIGYQKYYDVIEEYFLNVLDPANNGSEAEYNYELPDIVSDHLFDGKVTVISGSGKKVDGEEEDATQGFTQLIAFSEQHGGSGFKYEKDGKSLIVGYEGCLEYKAEQNGDGTYKDNTIELVFEFEGTELYLMTSVKDTFSSYTYSLDGGEYVTQNFILNNPLLVVKNIPSGKHLIKIRIKISSINASYMKNTLKGSIKIGAIFTRDADEQTLK